MPCYKEFPEQIKKFTKDFVEQNNFRLVDFRDDYYLRYSDYEWNIIFYCEYGAVDLSMINLKDGFKYNLGDIFKELYPESNLSNEFSDNVYANEKTIKFWIDILIDIFPLLKNQYMNLKKRLTKHKERSFILIDFTTKNGSELLKTKFSWNNDDWIELASKEYTTYRKKKNEIDIGK